MRLRRIGSLIRKSIIVVLTLAAVGTGYLWVESYVRTYTAPNPLGGPDISVRGRQIDLWWEEDPHGIFFFGGGVRIHPGESLLCVDYTRGTTAWQRVPTTGWDGVELGGFYYCHSVQGSSGIVLLRIGAPMWALLLLFATYPTIAFIRGPLRRYRRRKRGLCLHCGYDLRGTTGGVCSECGEGVGER